MSWLLHVLGTDNVAGHAYAWWSGAGSDLSELALLGGLVRLIRQHRRHSKHLERSNRILADLYEHHSGTKHPSSEE